MPDQVVLEEGHKRKVIFSSFDPDCATLLSLKCARYPVFFLTCAGSKKYADPRMNSLEAALIFAKSSKLQVVLLQFLVCRANLHTMQYASCFYMSKGSKE